MRISDWSSDVCSSDLKNSAEYKMYSELTGEDYDRMFIANMIEHHKGAVDMAKLAQTNAKHQELKDMADDIVAAQSKEIAEMEKIGKASCRERVCQYEYIKGGAVS